LFAAAGVALSLGSVGAKTPPGRYTIPGDGTVKDTVTGLEWQQDVVGTFMWSASAAPGSAQAYCQGLSLNGGGWRLPSLRELRSLVDTAKKNPAIDTDAFPDKNSGSFWSSTPKAASSFFVWHVEFMNGKVDYAGAPADLLVRCVR